MPVVVFFVPFVRNRVVRAKWVGEAKGDWGRGR